jgi:lipoprotein NlpD
MVRFAQTLFFFSFIALNGCAGSRPAPHQLRGTWHTVKEDDTLVGISKRYQVDLAEIKELNDISTDQALRQRQEIFIPKAGGKRPGEGRAPHARRDTSSPPKAAASEKREQKGCGESGFPCLMWPVKGTLLRRFNPKGTSPHDGIDIQAAEGTEIRAAADGEVIYSGDKIKGYGNLVILRHADGLITVYAHNKTNRVKEGERVNSGDTIATLGDTGSATRPHLHFEVRKGEQPQDPMDFLPRTQR